LLGAAHAGAHAVLPFVQYGLTQVGNALRAQTWTRGRESMVLGK
jgi:hypothetical protein